MNWESPSLWPQSSFPRWDFLERPKQRCKPLWITPWLLFGNSSHVSPRLDHVDHSYPRVTLFLPHYTDGEVEV